MSIERHIYIVKSKESGKILAMGSSKQCAKTLGVLKTSFYTLVSKAKIGEGPYDVTFVDLRNRTSMNGDVSPCNSCRDRDICNVSYCCPQWKKWYIQRHEQIRKMFSQI